jgi:predicted phosphodiesterase
MGAAKLDGAGVVGRAPVLRLAGAAASGAAAAVLGVAAFQGTSATLGPATVRIQAGAGAGVTTISIPPLGTVAAPTHPVPFGLQLTVTAIDFGALAAAADAGLVSDELVEQLEGDLRAAALRAAAQAILLSAAAGAVAGALWTPRRWGHVLAGAVGGAALVSAAVVVTATTFDADAFREPRFSGPLVRAPQVIEAAQAGLTSLDDLRSRYEQLAARVSRLLALAAEPSLEPSREDLSILHVSDIHSNPLGLEVAHQLARSFAVDAVVDTGDLTSFGLPVEREIRRLVRRFTVPYLFVPGNHDSEANRRAVGDTPGVRLLDGTTFVADGVTILGFADPTFTASAEVSTDEGNALRVRASTATARVVARVEPDVLAVHDVRLGSRSLGAVPLVIAGHTHERARDVVDGTLVLTVGSTGATGLGSFTAETATDYEAEILYFRAGELTTVDYITFHGLGDEFEIDREVFDPPDGALRES